MNALELKLKQLMEARGAISVAEFMEIVIPYYYANNTTFGRQGDFITAPEVSQLFGQTVAIWLVNHIKTYNIQLFNLIEMGPGRGVLMGDILHSLKSFPDVAQRLRQVSLLESSPRLRAIQKQALEKYDYDVSWVDGLNDVIQHPLATNILINNEFFDCLPVRQFLQTKLGMREIMVEHSRNNFEFTIDNTDFSPPEHMKVGDIYEHCDQYLNYVRDMARLMRSGGKGAAALIIDYGYNNPIKKSTLQAVKSHKYHSILQDIGAADLTALVNFKELQRLFALGKFKCNFSTQGDFLRQYGIIERADALTAHTGQSFQREVERLTSEEHMGELFKVLEIYC